MQKRVRTHFPPAALSGKGAVVVKARRFRNAGLTMAAAQDLLSGLAEGVHVFGLTKGQASMVDLILAAAEHCGDPFRLDVWTWVVAEYELDLLESLIADRRLSQFRLVVDRGCLKNRPSFIRSVVERFGSDSVRQTLNHGKLAMIRGPKLDVLIRGSMNFNSNPRFEQFDATASRDLCDWFEGIMSQIWEGSAGVTAGLVEMGEATAQLDGFGREESFLEDFWE